MRVHGRRSTAIAGLILAAAFAGMPPLGCSHAVDNNDIPKHAAPAVKARAREAIGEQQSTHPAELPTPDQIEPPPHPPELPEGASGPPSPAKPPPPRVGPQ